MTGPDVLRPASDLVRIRAIVALAEALSAFAPDLVVIRGSSAVLAHAPRLARVPNDLDIFWLGASREVVDLVRSLSNNPRLRVVATRAVAPPDHRVCSLHRVDVLVWLSAARRPAHRLWLDIGTSRRMVRAETVELAITPLPAATIRAATLLDVLAEKLYVYVASTRRQRGDLRWTDLFDMLALVHGAPGLDRPDPTEIRAAVRRYFAGRDTPMPMGFPAPPPEWRSAWYRLSGPISRTAPDLERAGVLSARFWCPVLGAHAGSDGSTWDANQWCWAPAGSNAVGPRRLGGDDRQDRLDLRATDEPFRRSRW